MTKEVKSIPAKTLKLLGNKPAEFYMPVVLGVLGSDPVKFEMRVKALRKSEWATLRDDRQKQILQAAKPEDVKEDDGSPIDAAIAMIDRRGFAAKVQEAAERDAKLIMQFAISWPGDEPLNEETLIALEDECGGALETIINVYDQALFFGRLGN